MGHAIAFVLKEYSMGRATQIEDEGRNVSIDIDYRILAKVLIVTDFSIFVNDGKDGWTEVTDKKKARELYEQYNGDNLIWKYFEFKPEPYFEEVAS